MLKFSMVAEREWELVNITSCVKYHISFSNIKPTFPIVAVCSVPKVVAHLVTSHPLHGVGGLQRVQNDPVFFHLSPVHLHTGHIRSESISKAIHLASENPSSVPSSLPPPPPAASWRHRRHPAVSRSCDSSPSPPPKRHMARCRCWDATKSQTFSCSNQMMGEGWITGELGNG